MRHLRRHAGSWLAAAWVAGTVAAVVVAVMAVNLAGSKVTTRPIASVSRQGVEEALAGDATTVYAAGAFGSGLTTDSLDDHGAVTDGSTSDQRAGSGGSSSAGAASGSSDGSSAVTKTDDGSGSGGTPTPGGSGSGTHDGSTTTTEAEHPAVTTTTTAPASAPVTRSFSGNSVTVQCSGDSIKLISSTAASGYGKTVGSAGPAQVAIKFRPPSGEGIEVEAECSSGHVSWG